MPRTPYIEHDILDVFDKNPKPLHESVKRLEEYNYRLQMDCNELRDENKRLRDENAHLRESLSILGRKPGAK